MSNTDDFDDFGPSPHKDHALDYIAHMLSELSEMAAATGKVELADLIRDSHRVAAAEKQASRAPQIKE